MTHPEAGRESPVRSHVLPRVWDHPFVPDMHQGVPEERARDILAAEAFAVPAPDPRLRHDVVVPADPAGIAEPHDILAAEEFAMPAPGPTAAARRYAESRRRRRLAWLGLPAGLLLFARRLRRRRR